MTDPAQRLETALGDRSAMERERGAGGMAPVYFAREEELPVWKATRRLREVVALAHGHEHRDWSSSPYPMHGRLLGK